MTIKDTLERKIQRRITGLKTASFMPADFKDLSGKPQVNRALKKLVNKNQIIRIGRGLYVRAKLSTVTNMLIPEKNLQEIALEVLERLNIEVVPSPFLSAYNKRLSTQVPTGRVIFVKSKINRKIGFNGNYIHFINVSK